MPIEWLSGDLFENVRAAQALAHGCNCQGSMGAGIARTFRERYPAMFEAYRLLCKAVPRQFNPGDCWLWRCSSAPWVFNLATQEAYWRGRASYEAIETALHRMRCQADAEPIARIAMPRIGVGYGGLSWKKVRLIIKSSFDDWAGELFVYEEYVPAAAESVRRTFVAERVSTSRHGGRDRERPIAPDGLSSTEADHSESGVIVFSRSNKKFGAFSNFSSHSIELRGTNWPSIEHYYQAQKFAGTPAAEEVRLAGSPRIARKMGRSRSRSPRVDWDAVKDSVMYEAVHAKFHQHKDLGRLLVGTGCAKLVEHSPHDPYWGDGGDGLGENRLGQILMRVRDELGKQAGST